MNILSFQSSVAFGHVGNAAAVFPLQRLGFEVWPVNTVQFSNHPGYGHWGGSYCEASHVRAVVDGLARLGALEQCDGVLSGYLGQAALGPAVLEAVERVRQLRPDAPYLCDPVMGDDGPGLYVSEGVAEFLAARALPASDIITPNRFELQVLSGQPAGSVAEAVRAARALLARGPRLVVVTSLGGEEDATCLAATAEGAWAVSTPRLPFQPPVSGSGDTLAALLLAHFLRGEPAPQALSLAVSGLFGVLDATLRLGRREMALVQAQEEILRPSRVFAAMPA